jgi:hypothetical protein
MATNVDKPAETLTPFERFVQRLLRVPKSAIDEADGKRLKRASRKPTKKAAK